MIRDLEVKCRTYRRFYEDEAIDVATLHGLVDLARLSGSGWNKQPLKFPLSCDLPAVLATPLRRQHCAMQDLR